jgi:hypothetical protein
MPISKFPNRVTWRGLKTVGQVTRKLAQRKAVVVSLPWSFHHALCVQLSDYARQHGILDVCGASDLLVRVAEITGLPELEQLSGPVRLAGAGVRIHSPPPQVHLFFPGPASRRRRHAHSRYEPSRMSTEDDDAPSAGTNSS